MSSTSETVEVPHLGGSTIGYRFGKPYDPSLPTVVMVNSYLSAVEVFHAQFDDETLSSAVNLLALEPYGHGATTSTAPQFTYWDSAQAILQAAEALGVGRFHALGVSQGGWITTRMALLAPERVLGLVVVGTSMDAESPESIERGCWDCAAITTPLIDGFAAPVDDDWTIPSDLVDAVLGLGLGEAVSDETRSFWVGANQATYRGDDGRHRLRVATINLRDRDGLHGRLDQVRCPVLWLHGTDDSVYSVANAENGIGRFTHAERAELRIVQNGQHILVSSHPAEVDAAVQEFVKG